MTASSVRAWLASAARAAAGRVRLDRPLPVLSGPLRGARWIPDASVRSCWLGTFEADEQARLAAVVRPGMRVYDLGANVGFYTLLASRLVGPTGRVVAVEPLPRNVALLRRHVALNGAANVEIVEAAVSDRPGVGRFTQSRSASENRLGAEGTLEVEVTTLPALAARFGAPNVIKIDVEGAEGAVLRGAMELIAAARPAILLSLHDGAGRDASRAIETELDYDVAIMSGSLPIDLAAELILTPRALG